MGFSKKSNAQFSYHIWEVLVRSNNGQNDFVDVLSSDNKEQRLVSFSLVLWSAHSHSQFGNGDYVEPLAYRFWATDLQPTTRHLSRKAHSTPLHRRQAMPAAAGERTGPWPWRETRSATCKSSRRLIIKAKPVQAPPFLSDRSITTSKVQAS